jgi:predicted GNAT family acetyltransferase
MERIPEILEPLARRGGVPRSRRARRPVPAESPTDPGALPTRQLRRLCDPTYQLLDPAGHPLETREQYDALVGELERREHKAAGQAGWGDARERFRDNALFSRFELHRDGAMAGYVQYELRGGQVLLLHAVVDPRFPHAALEPALMRAVFLEAHRRRLAVLPCCAEAQEFLADHPQFLPLVPARQRRRFRLLLASRAAATGQDAR